MTTTAIDNQQGKITVADIQPVIRVAAWLLLAHAALWGLLFFRWVTFASFSWVPFDFENALATFPPILAYVVYLLGLIVDLTAALMILRGIDAGRLLGLGRGVAVIFMAGVYWAMTQEFFGAVYLAGLAGLLLVMLTRQNAWAINYSAAFWLIIFFVLPNVIVLLISLSERGPRGTIIYPNLLEDGLVSLFNDYVRFFTPIGGQFIYLRIFWRSMGLAVGNTILCLLFGYPFAYWIARQEVRWRNILIFLVMIPFWTNFLVRTYAWLLLLRDSGLINNFWTSTLHEQAVALAGSSGFFAWLAEVTAAPLPLLFNTGSVFLGLFYGFFPFVVLPLYSNLEKLDWSLLEAASDLGANGYYRTTRVLLPLSLPGIVAASIIVFVPSLGAYVTPAIMGGGKVSLLGNLLQQQFMTARDWPFGSAIGFLMMAIMLLAILIYFRFSGEEG
ncbi:MAG: ABC transporter permease [Ardenticatenaceae bacterium]|nr:ABC transporter permease [Ardenticatenaceae bacterium]